MQRTTTTTLTATLLLALTACSSSGETASSKPAASTTSASPSTAKAYTYQDCVDLLDYDFTDGKPQDASRDPECAHLTTEEYAKAVGEVLTEHKDEILNPTSTP
ncbi:hypothetical protein ACFUJR_32660 [Streptomyces sp. NPDC057271]|uniref:hypothetical protein n=1 Tax=unclassified Streptomyces TaxID=2593676 RepID=UPI003635F814